MKTLLAAAALAAIIASPAFAQTGTAARPGGRASLAVRPAGRPRRGSAALGVQGNPVYDNNHYLGADPDPNVRLDLRRDFEGRDF